jgi:hypothetical protein
MSVVINNFNLLCTALRPLKAKSPLVIDTDAMLTFSIFLQGFKFVLWRDSQVIHITRPVEHRQLTQRNRFNIDPALDPNALKQLLSITTLEADDHVNMVTSGISNVKRYPYRSAKFSCFNRSSAFKA